MSRWMLAAAVVALFGVVANAEDRPAAKPAKVIRVLVLEDAQPLPAGPSSAPAVATGVIIDEPAVVGAAAECHTDAKNKKHSAKLSHVFRKEDCEGCGSLRYYTWFAFSSCRSFFSEGPYAPRWPDKCPACCPHH